MTNQEELAAIIDELTNRRRIIDRVPYWDRHRNKKLREHIVILDPLLTALADAAHPGHASDDTEGARRPPGSRPPLNLDAVDRWQEITREVTRWLNWLNLAARPTLAEDLRHLVGASGQMASGDLAALVVDARAWKTWAEVAAHERGTSWTPNAACPCCDHRNAVRVRADSQRAYCSRCGSTWDEDSIGILARHIAQSATAGRSPASPVQHHQPQTCRCACHLPRWQHTPRCSLDHDAEVPLEGGCGPHHLQWPA